MTKFIERNLTNSSIAGLLIIAVGLGAAIYLKNNPLASKSLVKASKAEKLTELEKSIFNSPGKDALEAERLAYSALIAVNAKDGNTVFIKDCTARPLVLRMSYGSEFTVNNEGTTDIHFGFGEERTLVKANTSLKIKSDFKNGKGIYGYGCDDPTLSRSIGVLLLTK